MKLINPAVPKFKELSKGIKEILDTKELTNGKYTELVEEEICKIHGCKYCVLMSSATNAFMVLLSAVNKLYKYDEIIMQDFTWESTKHIAELMTRGTIEYCDVDIDEWTAFEPTNKNALFIPNMTFGNVTTYDHKKTIYDSAHCLGNKECNGRGYGEIISFSPAKPISACEGGCVITNNKKIYEEVLRLRRYHGRMSEMNALFLYKNLKNLKKELDRKNDINGFYYLGLNSNFNFPQKDSMNTVFNEIVYTHPKMNKKKRKECEKLFPIRLRYKPWDKTNKNSKWIYDHQIVLPQVTGKEQEEVIKFLNEICN